MSWQWLTDALDALKRLGRSRPREEPPAPKEASVPPHDYVTLSQQDICQAIRAYTLSPHLADVVKIVFMQDDEHGLRAKVYYKRRGEVRERQ